MKLTNRPERRSRRPHGQSSPDPDANANANTNTSADANLIELGWLVVGYLEPKQLSTSATAPVEEARERMQRALARQICPSPNVPE